MRKTTNVLSCIVVFAGLVTVAGCELLPDPEFAEVERALSLSLIEASRSASAGAVDFELQLTNQGDTIARACLGPSRSVSYKTSSGGGVSSNDVDHPGCMREFTIESGGTMQWRESLRVSGLSSGRVELGVEIEVVNPRRCGGFGCTAIHIKSTNKREVS